ncbi:hypothetical protein AB0M47_17570, partial [Hamadaea sp. NPDC051192]|uniref:hypothetical protein n=1 Tax=Hamadaea sp. NPDC051192 TaxID=3154940 RepID=UPI00342548B2
MGPALVGRAGLIDAASSAGTISGSPDTFPRTGSVRDHPEVGPFTSRRSAVPAPRVADHRRGVRAAFP